VADRARGSRVYVTCQLAGWSAYAVIGLLITRLFQGLTPAIAVTNVLSCAVAGLLTHGIRGWIRRRRWLEFGVARMLPRLAGASVAAALVVVAVALGLGLYVTHAYVWSASTPAILVAASFNWIFVMLLWTSAWAALHALRHWRLAEIRRLELEVAARDAQLDALSARVQPHFFFNAMNGLRALIAEDPARAREMATELADLMRYALMAGRRDQVRLDEELAAVETYLRIESVRLESRLSWSLDVASADPGTAVPPMLLQTLVENAVKHGVAALPEGGAIEVRARSADGRLVLGVTGPGRLADAPGEGFGLELARERLRLLHGAAAEVALEPLEGGRVRAVATLPVTAVA